MLGQTQGPRVVTTELFPQRRLLLGHTAPSLLPGLPGEAGKGKAEAVRVFPSRPALTPPARRGRELSWTRMGIWTS